MTAVAVLAVLAAVGAVLLLGSSHGHSQVSHGGLSSTTPVTPSATKVLQGGVFTTSYQSSWTITTKRSSIGAALYKLSSTGAPIDNLGIPPAGTVGVTIAETPVSFFSSAHLLGAAPDPGAARQSAVELLPHLVGTPGGALHATLASPPRHTSLAGAEAAIESYGYTYAGVGDIQVDILSRRDGKVVLVELNVEPALASQGEAALETITRSWRWH